MEQGLPLPPATVKIAGRAMFLELRYVSPKRPPALDLAEIIGMAAPGERTAKPLEPAARIVGMDPAFFSPHFQRLGSVDAEIIQRRPMTIRRELGAREPARRKFIAAIGHVFSPEDAKREHLPRREFGMEAGAELSSDWFRPPIHIVLL